jgi:hypothetical protein
LERRVAIRQYPLEQQVDLYLNAMFAKHPPDLGLASVIASNGRAIVPVLVDRLVHEDSDVAKTYLMEVFLHMQQYGHYAVAADLEVMGVLEHELEGMKDRRWARQANITIRRIRESGERVQPGAEGTLMGEAVQGP